MTDAQITIFLADDNLLVREGVRALLSLEPDFEIVGVAEDYDGLVTGAESSAPQVIVTDIRMPPTFTREGIEAAQHVRKLHPGTGVVILSQYDEPEYAIALLSEGASGYAYLLKDRVAEGDQLARAIREVASGGSMLDPKIVASLVSPVTQTGVLSASEEELLKLVAGGKPIKAIAVMLRTTPADVSAGVEALFLKLAQAASAGVEGALQRLKMLHQVIVDREEVGETLSHFIPGGLAEKLRNEGHEIGRTEELTVTVLMSDIRGYSTIAESADPSSLAMQLNEHRARMNRAIIDESGSVMQFVGDAVMAVFGAPIPANDHAERAVVAARAMHKAQSEVNELWIARGLPKFHLGIGLSTGPVAAALLGSDERLEYTVVGDTVNLSQRLQQWADPGEIVLSENTYNACRDSVAGAIKMEPQQVKGRQAEVYAFKIPAFD
ncbi:MAG TPA: adenylate/guanylate cyclase domain-containing protein [Actinomycetota bacterium]|nr:adenylate/guanylate cyclase domain-containing protein [Actinomycetota bacterium]